ncbi:MAG: ImmA/IrrE family metallo-endopeptidase [Symploca sp. SIO1B1]|nr:ImmA/IrrE family metallo-endopeptidase [Symploca sp. SIO1B1]
MSLFKPFKFYAKEQIESLANGLLQEMQATPNYSPKWPFDATRVADFLDLGVIWETIPPDDKGAIAAMILPLKREIIINEDIPQLRGGFGESTLAHEIGHWILHINHKAVEKFVERADLGMPLPPQQFLCRSTSIQKGIEWQAQYFASCLLMPIPILEEKQTGRDLTNSRHLYAMAHELGVTISNLKNRLKNLDWIILSANSKQIYLGKAAPRRNKQEFG